MTPLREAIHPPRTRQPPNATPRPPMTDPARELLDQLLRALARFGHDDFHLDAVGPWSLEIRVAEFKRLKGWWQCALDRAANHARRPALIYRLGERGWQVLVALADCGPAFAGLDRKHCIEMDLSTFAALVVATQADPTARRAALVTAPRRPISAWG